MLQVSLDYSFFSFFFFLLFFFSFFLVAPPVFSNVYLIEETSVLNVSTERLITMDCGSSLHSDTCEGNPILVFVESEKKGLFYL